MAPGTRLDANPDGDDVHDALGFAASRLDAGTDGGVDIVFGRAKEDAAELAAEGRAVAALARAKSGNDS